MSTQGRFTYTLRFEVLGKQIEQFTIRATVENIDEHNPYHELYRYLQQAELIWVRSTDFY